MKRKLIETRREISIQCDNESCDYVIPYSEEIENNSAAFINAPCPNCGENLLTEQDYLLEQKLIKTIDWINRWFSWLTIFSAGKTKERTKVHIYDGKINIKQ